MFSAQERKKKQKKTLTLLCILQLKLFLWGDWVVKGKLFFSKWRWITGIRKLNWKHMPKFGRLASISRRASQIDQFKIKQEL